MSISAGFANDGPGIEVLYQRVGYTIHRGKPRGHQCFGPDGAYQRIRAGGSCLGLVRRGGGSLQQGGMGERCKLPHRGLGRSPSRFALFIIKS